MQQRLTLALALAALAVVGVAVLSGPHAGTQGPSPAPLPRETWTGAPGPKVGSVIPAFEARDQDGRLRSFDTLKGRAGLLLNFNRSVLW